MDVRLDGKVALVTGGAGGFGRAYAAALAAAGARLALADVDIDAAEATARTIGGPSRAYAVDLRVAAAVDELVRQVVADLGGLDILLNVAGRSGRFDTATMAEDDWDTILDGNLKGTFLACRAAIPHLIARGGGRIINMGSNRGIEGQSRGAAYAASKGGVIALSRSLAQELAPHRITVNVLAPGATDTAMWRRGRTDADAEAQLAAGNIGQPADLAPLVVLLASDLGAQLTGMTLLRDVFMPR
jgi:NAD(P)-dependent dehydrogenase (short-subunit alcohol dehydrogenase family)